MWTRTRAKGQVESMRAVEVFVDAAEKTRWDESTQNQAEKQYSGAVYRLVSSRTDRDMLDGLESRMRRDGMAPALMANGMSELAEYSVLITEDRFLRIKSSFQQLFLFKRGEARSAAWQLYVMSAKTGSPGGHKDVTGTSARSVAATAECVGRPTLFNRQHWDACHETS